MKKSMTFLVAGLALAAVPAAAEEASAGTSPAQIEISTFTCKELMAGDDSDRGACFAFFHGYLAAKKGVQRIDLTATRATTERVQDYCLSNPTSTVMDAFTKSAK